MKAIIVATGATRNSEVEFENCPRELLPLIDRPFIQYVVENLVEQGIVEFDFILSHQPEKFEKLLGDGTRWGSKFTFHLARDADRPYRLLKSINRTDEPFLLVHADRLLPAGINTSELDKKGKPQIFYYTDETAQAVREDHWTGYSFLTQKWLLDFADQADQSELAKLLMKKENLGVALVETEKPLSVLSYEDLIASQHSVLLKKTPLANFSANENEKGIWISRNVSLHPSAKINAPVFIGENCRIGENAEIGPNVVIGSNCLIDKKCSVENSIIAAGSFLGENLHVSDSVILKNKIANTRLETKLSIPDNFILGNLFDRQLKRWLTGIFSQFAGIFLFIGALPFLLMTAVWLKLSGVHRIIKYKETVLLPAVAKELKLPVFDLLTFDTQNAPGESFNWGTGGAGEIFFRFLPALLSVAKGKMRIVGVRPRTIGEIKIMPADWRELYLSSKTGLITEAFVQYGANPTTEELCAAECIYAVRAGFRYDLKLVAGYLKRLFQNLFTRPASRNLKITRR